MKIKDGFVLEQVGGAYLAVAVGDRAENFNALIRMNGSGAFLWKLMVEKDVTADELLQAMLAEYEVDEQTAKSDIQKFVNQLSKGGLLE